MTVWAPPPQKKKQQEKRSTFLGKALRAVPYIIPIYVVVIDAFASCQTEAHAAILSFNLFFIIVIALWQEIILKTIFYVCDVFVGHAPSAAGLSGRDSGKNRKDPGNTLRAFSPQEYGWDPQTL